MARQSMKTMLTGVEYIGRPKLIDRNTVSYERPNGDNVIRLHATDIIVTARNGAQTLSSGGWKTVTTADRIRRYSKANLVSVRGVWYLQHGDTRVPFVDGIRISANGKLPRVPKSVADKQTKLGKQISAFVNLVGKDGAPIPTPSAGDCWFCALRDQHGHTMGEHDPSHLLDHIKEGYLHGSLIVNAMRWAGYTDSSIGVMLQGLGGPRHTSIKSALRRFLRRKLSLTT